MVDSQTSFPSLLTLIIIIIYALELGDKKIENQPSLKNFNLNLILTCIKYTRKVFIHSVTQAALKKNLSAPNRSRTMTFWLPDQYSP